MYLAYWPGVARQPDEKSMNLTGYLDESINKDRRLFTMSAIIAERMDWMWFEVDWENCIEKINRQLKKDGRIPISRYHASDCSNRKGEFAGWTKEELNNFAKQLLNVLRAHNTKTISYTIDLVAIAEAFPQWKSDPLRGGYDFLTAFLVREIGEWLSKCGNPNAKIKLIHDRCQYQQVIQDSFQGLMSHPKFAHRIYFEAVEPCSWQECKLLQAADLVAYESMKDAETKIDPRNRRKSIQLLLDIESFGMTAKYIGSDEADGISKAWKAHVESLSS
jgi:Protein of unknown function (DUF3800)